MANMDRLDPSKAEDAKRIRKMILSEVESDNGSVDDGTESDEDYVEPREGDSESSEDATSDDVRQKVLHTFDGKGKIL
jgi:hypothetical protein